MNFSEFEKKVDERQKNNPIWFGLESDCLPSELDLVKVQKNLGVEFPEEYMKFIKKYGGGYFALGVVYSLDPSSDFNIFKINEDNSSVRDGYVLFSDNGSGDFYAFKVSGNRCLSGVCARDHETGEWQETKYGNIFSFLIDVALSN